MKSHILVLLFSVLLINAGFAQLSDRISLFMSAGTAFPAQSVMGQSFTFPQLNYLTGTDFAKDLLGLQPDNNNFNEYWTPAVNIGAGLQYNLGSMLAIIGSVNYNHFNLNNDRLAQDMENGFEGPLIDLPFNPDGLEINKGTITSYEIRLNLKAQYAMKIFRPYLLVGGGYLSMSQESISLNYYDDYMVLPGPQLVSISFYEQIPGDKQQSFMVNGGGGILFHFNKNLQPYIEANYVLGLTEGQNTVYYPLQFGFLFSLK